MLHIKCIQVIALQVLEIQDPVCALNVFYQHCEKETITKNKYNKNIGKWTQKVFTKMNIHLQTLIHVKTNSFYHRLGAKKFFSSNQLLII